MIEVLQWRDARAVMCLWVWVCVFSLCISFISKLCCGIKHNREQLYHSWLLLVLQT